MKLVEVIPGQETSDDITNLTINFVKSVNKIPVTCRKDVPGFIVIRLFIPLVHEACYVMERQKIQQTEIDSAVKFKLGSQWVSLNWLTLQDWMLFIRQL